MVRSDVELGARDGAGSPFATSRPLGAGPDGTEALVPDGCVLAIDFGGSKIAVAVRRATDPAGAARPTNGGGAADGAAAGIGATGVVETAPELGADANVARGVELARHLLAGSRVAAVGACTFGIPREDGVAMSPAIKGWDRLPLRALLEDAFAAPVAVDTDVKAAALAEVRHGALAGAEPAIYLNLGTGLAVALVSRGAVVRGAHGAAGEIGSSLLKSPASGAGGVLEDVVSGMGLARAMTSRRVGPGGRTAADAGLVAELFASARHDGNAAFEAILVRFLDELCFHMVNLTVALDPERIAVGGGLVRSWDRIEGPLRQALDAHVPYPPELVTGAFPFDAALRGAIDLGMELARASREPRAGSAGLGGDGGRPGPGGAGAAQRVVTRREGRTRRDGEPEGGQEW